MSTKVAEACPSCTTPAAPKDSPIAVEYEMHELVVKMWRYVCECGNVWANAAQRSHNEQAVNSAITAASNRSIYS
jgi:hypothetical protein